MSTLETLLAPAAGAGVGNIRELLVSTDSSRKPTTVARLNDWQYLERSLHRLLAAWGRNFSEWDDKTALHRQIWEHAEAVRRIRERLADFPGSAQHMDAPVCQSLEELANTVLLAPSFEDALDGIYQLLTNALVTSYLDYARAAHPVHDAPTIAMLHQIIGIKEGQRLWFRGYRRRHPHTTDAEYSVRIETALARCAHLAQALLVDEDNPAQTAGLRTDFRLPEIAGRAPHTAPRHNFMPYVEADFTHSIEARRLFWCYGYMLEQGLADDQLRWIYDAHWMPWEFLQDISRHLWDESRHGDSGHSRLLDFGITIDVIGFPQQVPQEDNRAEPLSRAQLYDRVFSCGMIAETGHFAVKREAYDDFKNGGDLESAEMMLFDIIDETTHVQYAHKWLPIIAESAGIDSSDYRERGAQMRAQMQQDLVERVKGYADLPRGADNPDYAFYQHLLQVMRDKKPLSNVATCPPRSPKPM